IEVEELLFLGHQRPEPVQHRQHSRHSVPLTIHSAPKLRGTCGEKAGKESIGRPATAWAEGGDPPQRVARSCCPKAAVPEKIRVRDKQFLTIPAKRLFRTFPLCTCE